MAITFIHAADLHLDRPFQGLSDLPNRIRTRLRESTFSALDKLVTTAIQNQVDFVVLVGDIFDESNRSLRAQMRLKIAFEQLAEHSIDVFMLHGNHDPLDGEWHELTFGNNVHVFKSHPHVIQFNKKGKPLVNLYGFSYGSRHIKDNMVQMYQKQNDADFHIGLLHGSVKGNSEHDVYAPFSIQELLDKKFNYWALGHIHKREELHIDPPIHYSGSLQGLTVKEIEDKGFYLVSLEKSACQNRFISAADIIWEHTTLNMEKVPDVNHLITLLEKEKEKVRRDEQGVLLRVDLKNNGDLYSIIRDEDNIEAILEATRESESDRHNFVWIISINNYMKPAYNREKLRKESHFLGDLLMMSENIEYIVGLDELFKHSQGKKFLRRLTEQDYKHIIDEAESVLLDHLIQDID